MKAKTTIPFYHMLSTNLKMYMLTFGLLLMVYACTPPKESFYPDNIAERTFQLEGTKWEYDTLKSPYKLYIINKLLFATQNSRVDFDEPMIHVFDRKTLKHLGALGKNGLGPNEMLSTSYLDLYPIDTTLLVFDGRNKRISTFSFNQVAEKRLLAQEQTVLPTKMFDAYKNYKASDSTYLGISTQKEYMFNEYDLEGNWINGYGLWPEPANNKQLSDFTGMERNFLLVSMNSGRYRKKFGGDWYGLAMNYRDRIELFNYKTKELRSIEGPELIDEIQPFRIAGSDAGLGGAYGWDAQYTYRELVFKNKYIYALYGGHSQVDYERTGIISKKIFVFSYDTELIGKIELDRSVRALEVDEELGKIYTITTDENPGIAVFDLPEVLLNK